MKATLSAICCAALLAGCLDGDAFGARANFNYCINRAGENITPDLVRACQEAAKPIGHRQECASQKGGAL